MTVRVAINGLGRMGKLGLRAGWDLDGFDIVHINEIKGDASCHAHLLEFDSVHGSWKSGEITAAENVISVAGQEITFSQHGSPAEMNLAEHQIDIVLECSGQFKTVEQLQPYFAQGVKKVIVSAPVPDPALNIVYGVNHAEYKHDVHDIITAASCTTNCLAPVVKVMNESLGIRHGCMTTIHNITNTQTIIDKGHSDLRRARACGNSLIPTTTGSAKAITKIFPELDGKLNGLAVRVPLTNASITDFVFEASRSTTVEEVNELFRQASEKSLKNILGYETRPLVSVDYTNDNRSSIIDAPSTMVIDNTQVKVLAWYDNEWGYVNRMMELTQFVAQQL